MKFSTLPFTAKKSNCCVDSKILIFDTGEIPHCVPAPALFRRVLVADTRGLTEHSADLLEEADREFVWRRFVRGAKGYVFLIAHGR